MQRSVFGLFTALLGVLCVLSAIPAFRKKRYGLAVFLFLNAFTNLVNTIHAFYGTLFHKRVRNKWLEIVMKKWFIVHFVAKTKKK